MHSQINDIISWSNENPGTLTIILFLVVLVTGAFAWLIKDKLRRPKFSIKALPGPSFCCTIEMNKKYKGYSTYRTAFSIYLKVDNRGRCASSISAVEFGYHNYTFRYSFLWYWLQPTPAISDFRRPIGDNYQYFPFLFQRSILLPNEVKTYLEVGDSTNGIVYFEQAPSWGGFRPRIKKNSVRSILRVRDAFGRWHSSHVSIPVVNLDEAREYCPDFGRTYEEIEKTNNTENSDE